MLKLIFFCCKVMVFSLGVLVLGHWLQWQGQSISTHVQQQMVQMEKSVFLNEFKNGLLQVARSVQTEFQKKMHFFKNRKPAPFEEDFSRTSQTENITRAEQEQLKALIKKLNHSMPVRHSKRSGTL